MGIDKITFILIDKWEYLLKKGVGEFERFLRHMRRISYVYGNRSKLITPQNASLLCLSPKSCPHLNVLKISDIEYCSQSSKGS